MVCSMKLSCVCVLLPVLSSGLRLQAHWHKHRHHKSHHDLVEAAVEVYDAANKAQEEVEATEMRRREDAEADSTEEDGLREEKQRQEEADRRRWEEEMRRREEAEAESTQEDGLREEKQRQEEADRRRWEEEMRRREEAEAESTQEEFTSHVAFQAREGERLQTQNLQRYVDDMDEALRIHESLESARQASLELKGVELKLPKV
eukprot:gnl/TRDRNA2_/TRDRNA2_175794_c7_seq25.p1 gnl/TRDRNA2_/TRDRNA2_175794_c7~~gnl/TRDRNA2_/TRDRNA2_175794_c7_seq25.p1  ORF type:complete len:204 (+),score=56.49 gnl/TRDRNA2_/TRDRNA2_175794_c7_seq25:51-662(+)